MTMSGYEVVLSRHRGNKLAIQPADWSLQIGACICSSPNWRQIVKPMPPLVGQAPLVLFCTLRLIIMRFRIVAEIESRTDSIWTTRFVGKNHSLSESEGLEILFLNERRQRAVLEALELLHHQLAHQIGIGDAQAFLSTQVARGGKKIR